MRQSNQGTPHPYRSACIIMGIAVGVTGVTFGVFADAAGLDLPRIVAMSALVFTGASQFAAVGVINDGGTGAAAIGPALLLAARNILYGPVVRRVLPDSTMVRLGAAQFVIDATTGMAAAQAARRDAAGAFWLAATTLWLCWNLGSIAGAMLGPVMGEAETWGLDAAFPAIFAAMLAPHLRTTAGRATAAAAAVIAVGAAPFSAPGIPILLTVLALPLGLHAGTRQQQSPESDSGSEVAP